MLQQKISIIFLCVVWALLFSANTESASFNSMMRNGVEYYRNQDYEGAIKSFEEAQSEKPRDPEVLYNKGNSEFRLGNYEKALDSFSQTLESEASHSLKQKALFNKGNTFFRMGKLQEAEATYKKVLELDPNEMDAKFNLEFVRKKLNQQMQQQQQKNNKDNNSENKKQDSQGKKGQQNQDSNGDKDSKDKEDQPSSNTQMENEKMAQNSQGQSQKEGSRDQEKLPGEKEPHQVAPAEDMTPEEAEQWLRSLEEDPKTIKKKQAIEDLWKEPKYTGNDW